MSYFSQPGIPSAPTSVHASEMVTQLLQNGLGDCLEQMVREQVEQALQDPRTLGCVDLVAPFDPDEPQSDIDKWLEHFEQLAVRYGWTELERIHFFKQNLSGRGRNWCEQVNLLHPHLRWNDWKREVWRAFADRPLPLSFDYAANLEQMLTRRKRPSEPLVAYLRDKLALCEKCGIWDNKAVSCMISGLPVNLRRRICEFGCSMPGELMHVASRLEEPERFAAEFVEERRVFVDRVTVVDSRTVRLQRRRSNLGLRHSKMPRSKIFGGFVPPKVNLYKETSSIRLAESPSVKCQNHRETQHGKKECKYPSMKLNFRKKCEL